MILNKSNIGIGKWVYDQNLFQKVFIKILPLMIP